jgi:glycosyltransferase involved in cell wall biosynthesis
VATTDPNRLGRSLPGEEMVLIRQRNVILDGEPLMGHAELVKMGFLTVTEFDDDPEHFPVVAENRYLTFSACHAVQTSTEALADAIRPHNPNVRVFPNQIALLPPLRKPRENGPVTLFFGALNREADWADLVAPLNRVLADRGDAVRVRIVHDWAFYDAIETEEKEFEKFCPYDRYIEILRSADIAILPLNPTRFNLCKSDLKFIECAAHGVVAMASPTVYGATLRDGETGVIFDSPEEFEAGLNRLLDDAALRRSIVENAHRYVAENRMLSTHFRERYEWYRELRERLPELTRQLRERVPEMFG